MSAQTENPAISVILPAYNAERYIGEAIDSILSQTFTDFELIVVDDGSTDRTLEIVHGYSDCRLLILSNKENLGLSKSLNKGISVARGRYIARQDADDFSLPERLEKQRQHLQEHPQIVLLGTGRKTMLPNGKIKKQRSMPPNPTFEDMLKRNCFVHGSVMIRKTVLDSVGVYNESFLSSEDYELWLRITKSFSSANLPESLYVIRQHSDRLTQKFKKITILYELLAREIALEKISDEDLAQFHKEGIESYYQHLPDKDKIHYHKKLADTYRHNKRYPDALQEYSYLRDFPGCGWKIPFYIWSLKLRGYKLKSATPRHSGSLDIPKT